MSNYFKNLPWIYLLNSLMMITLLCLKFISTVDALKQENAELHKVMQERYEICMDHLTWPNWGTSMSSCNPQWQELDGAGYKLKGNK